MSAGLVRAPDSLDVRQGYRWVAEMEEIAEFVSSDEAGEELFIGNAHLYERLAADFAGAKAESGQLALFLKNPSKRLASALELHGLSCIDFAGTGGEIGLPTGPIKDEDDHGPSIMDGRRSHGRRAFSGTSVEAAPNGETYKTRLSVVPLDVGMQATVAGQGSVTATLAGNKLTVSGTAEGLRSPRDGRAYPPRPAGIPGLRFSIWRSRIRPRPTISGTVEPHPFDGRRSEERSVICSA